MVKYSRESRVNLFFSFDFVEKCLFIEKLVIVDGINFLLKII